VFGLRSERVKEGGCVRIGEENVKKINVFGLRYVRVNL